MTYVLHTARRFRIESGKIPVLGEVELSSFLEGLFFGYFVLQFDTTVWHFDFTEPALRSSSSSLFEVSFRVCMQDLHWYLCFAGIPVVFGFKSYTGHIVHFPNLGSNITFPRFSLRVH